MKAKNSNIQEFSDFKGEVEINTNDSVEVTCLGYESQTLLLLQRKGGEVLIIL